jgi:hypothetical protein
MNAVRRAGVVLVATAWLLYSADSHAEDPAAGRSSGRTARVLGWVTLSLGAEAAIVAVTTSFLLLHEKNVRDAECDAQKTCSQRGLDANSSIASLVSWNTASWIVAAAGLGGGAFLLLTHRPEARQTAIGVSPSAAGVELKLWSTF